MFLTIAMVIRLCHLVTKPTCCKVRSANVVERFKTASIPFVYKNNFPLQKFTALPCQENIIHMYINYPFCILLSKFPKLLTI